MIFAPRTVRTAHCAAYKATRTRVTFAHTDKYSSAQLMLISLHVHIYMHHQLMGTSKNSFSL